MSDDVRTSIPGWPKCPACHLTSVRDGGICSICAANARVRIDGHAYLPSPPSGTAPAYRPCDYAGCGEPWWRHKLYAPASVGEYEGTAPGAVMPAAPSLRVARNGVPTSEAAADRVAPKAGSQRAMVLAELVSCDDGATDDELAQRLGLPLNSVRPRRGELVDAGMVMDSGDTRPTEQGNEATVWLPTLAGLEWYDRELAGARSR